MEKEGKRKAGQGRAEPGVVATPVPPMSEGEFVGQDRSLKLLGQLM